MFVHPPGLRRKRQRQQARRAIADRARPHGIDIASGRGAFGDLRAFYEMNYVLVPDNQPRLTIPFLDYPDESDLDGGTFPNGNYPIPPNMPIESWPKDTGSLSLSQWQMDVNKTAAIATVLWLRRVRDRFGKRGR